MTDESAPASARRSDAALVKNIDQNCPETMARRKRNLHAMWSPASIALGACALLLVALVCTFYDHPAMKTPQLFSSLNYANAKPL